MENFSEIRPHEILIVIPTFNEGGNIRNCVESLIGGDEFFRTVRMVVVDGGSHDNTIEVVNELVREYPSLRCLHNPKRLQSAGLNLAVETWAENQLRFLIRCDAHSVYPKGFMWSVLDCFAKHPDAASVVSVMDATGNSCKQKAISWIVDTPLGSGGSAHRGGRRSGWVDHGHHVGFRVDWFRRIGGYDESFSHNEDAEYDYRLRQAGGKIWLESSVRLKYIVRNSLWALWLQYWRYGRGRCRNIVKHRSLPKFRQTAPVFFFLGLTSSLSLAIFWPIAFLPALFYFGAMTVVSIVCVLRIGGPCGLWAGVAMAVIHLAWGGGFLFQSMASLRGR